MRIVICVLAFLGFAILQGCGGGGSSDPTSQQQQTPPPPPPPPPNPVGLYAAVVGGSPAALLIAPDGGFFYLTNAPGCIGLYAGQFTLGGGVATGTGDFAPSFQVNTTCGNAEQDTFTGTYDATTFTLTSHDAAGNSFTIPWTLDAAVTNQGASLADVQGTYADGNAVLTVDSLGNIFEQDPASGCVLSGLVSVIDPKLNVYQIQVTVENCTGPLAVANGLAATGLATYNNTDGKAFFGIEYQTNSGFFILNAFLQKE